MNWPKIKVVVVTVLTVGAIVSLSVIAIGRTRSISRPITLEWSVDVWELYFPALIEKYEREHPDVHIALRVMGGGSTQKVYTMLVANQLSDIISSSQRNLLAENDAVEPVPVNDPKFKELLDDTLPMCKAMACNSKGTMIYIPASYNLKPLIFVNKKFLKEAHMTVEDFPEDFEGWAKAMMKLAKYSSSGSVICRPFHMRGTFFAYGYPWILSTVKPRPASEGGRNSINDFVGDGVTRPLRFDTPEIIEGLKRWRKVFVGPMQIADGEQERVPGMKKGRYAGAAGGNWLEGEIFVGAPHLKWMIIPPPRAKNGKRWIYASGGGYAVARQSKHKEEAWEFVRFLCSPECQAEAYLVHGYLPARNAGWDVAEKKQGPGGTLVQYRSMKDCGVWDEINPTWVRVGNEVITSMLEKVVSVRNPVEPAEAAAWAQKEATAIIAGEK